MVESSRAPERGRITHGPTKSLIEQTLEFIHSQLSLWRDDPDRRPQESERKLNLQFCDYLDCAARFDFPMVRFSPEEPQVGRRSVDLAAKPAGTAVFCGRTYTKYDAFLVIEGKRLPAPKKDREREYVSGGKQTTGGIQRFKLGAHGAELDVAAMIAYVQEGGAGDWHPRVNGWILELVGVDSVDGCTWEANETLIVVEHDTARGTLRCRSSHGRSGGLSGNRITLFHFWVAMNVP